MELNKESIAAVLLRELKKVTINKNNVSKHDFNKSNNYQVRTISLTIDKETKEEDFSLHLASIMDELFIDDISTTYVNAKQKYSKNDAAKTLSAFSKYDFENSILMFHLTEIFKKTHKSLYKGQPLKLNGQTLEDYKAGKMKPEDITLSPEFVVSSKPHEVTLVLTIMFKSEV